VDLLAACKTGGEAVDGLTERFVRITDPWSVTLGQVAFGIAMGMAISLYVFAIKDSLR
jgi:hypothetical protein